MEPLRFPGACLHVALSIIPLTTIQLLLLDPLAQRLTADPKLHRHILIAPPGRLHQTNRLPPKLRRIRPLKPLFHLASPLQPDGLAAKPKYCPEKRVELTRSG